MRLLKSIGWIVSKLLPDKAAKHYVYPLLIRRPLAPYNPCRFFESYYRALQDQEFSDRMTIGPECKPLLAKYHYNAVENSILEYLASKPPVHKPVSLLDAGTGTGHWIDFYRELFSPEKVVGVEISEVCAERLVRKYEGCPNVHIISGDISDPTFHLGQRFDLISAVGVFFHIVEDERWKRALRNLADHLNDDGIIIASGQFGWITQNVQFHATDEFLSYKDSVNAASPTLLVNKRVRSLALWKKCTREAGLRIVALKRTRQRKAILTPENNVLILSRK